MDPQIFDSQANASEATPTQEPYPFFTFYHPERPTYYEDLYASSILDEFMAESAYHFSSVSKLLSNPLWPWALSVNHSTDKLPHQLGFKRWIHSHRRYWVAGGRPFLHQPPCCDTPRKDVHLFGIDAPRRGARVSVLNCIGRI